MMKMTVLEVSKKYGVSVETVRRWIRNGKIKASINSRKEGYYITTKELEMFEMTNFKYGSKIMSLDDTNKYDKFEKYIEEFRVYKKMLLMEKEKLVEQLEAANRAIELADEYIEFLQEKNR